MDLARTQRLLEDKLAELLDRAGEIEEKLSDPGEKDWSENAIEMEDDEVRVGIGLITKKELLEIENAIHRIKTGEYGKCAVCGQPINKTRLAVLPQTTTCIQCA